MPATEEGEPCNRTAAFDAGVRVMRAWLAIGVEAHRRFYVLCHGGFRGCSWAVVASPGREDDAQKAFKGEFARAQRGAVALYGRGRVLEFLYVQKKWEEK